MNPNSGTDVNTAVLISEIKWLERVIQFRTAKHSGRTYYELDPAANGSTFNKPHQPDYKSVFEIIPPPLVAGSRLHDLLLAHRAKTETRLLLALALASYVNPAVFEPFYSITDPHRIPGLVSLAHPNKAGYFKPTGLTWIWLLAGDDLAEKIRLLLLLDSPESELLENDLLLFDDWHESDPPYCTPVYIKPELFHQLLNIPNL